MKTVTVYSTPSCTYCQMSKQFFKDNNVEYTDHDVSQDDAMRNEMVEKSGQMGVPVIEIDGQIVVGFDEAKLKELLEL